MMFVTLNRKRIGAELVAKNRVQLAFFTTNKTTKGLRGHSPTWEKKYSITIPLTTLNQICDYADRVEGAKK